VKKIGKILTLSSTAFFLLVDFPVLLTLVTDNNPETHVVIFEFLFAIFGGGLAMVCLVTGLTLWIFSGIKAKKQREKG
jgi:hypothetical protein